MDCTCSSFSVSTWGKVAGSIFAIAAAAAAVKPPVSAADIAARERGAIAARPVRDTEPTLDFVFFVFARANSAPCMFGAASARGVTLNNGCASRVPLKWGHQDIW